MKVSLTLSGQSLPTLGRAVCFTQSADSNVNFIRNILTHTHPKCLTNVWALYDPVTLIHKMNHHIQHGSPFPSLPINRADHVTRSSSYNTSFQPFRASFISLKASWLFTPMCFHSCSSLCSSVITPVLVWVLWKAESETEMQEEVIYLRGDPRKHQQGSGEAG